MGVRTVILALITALYVPISLSNPCTRDPSLCSSPSSGRDAAEEFRYQTRREANREQEIRGLRERIQTLEREQQQFVNALVSIRGELNHVKEELKALKMN